jgi:hypothetical protein
LNLSSFKNTLSRHNSNIAGWRSKRKFLVIESDDWGSIRMPSREVYEMLLKTGIRVDLCHYNRYDSLATVEDLESLFNVLHKYHDINGNHPVLTANTVVANPDFEQTKASGFNKYHFELFTDTIKNYPGCQNSFALWKQGIDIGIFHPQFHGREHLNVNRWMKALQNGSEETRISFEHKLFGISTTITSEKRKSYLAALDIDDFSEIQSQQLILEQGLGFFENIFGYKSESFIAPNYTWHINIEETLARMGVRYIQGGSNQNQPTVNGYKVIKHKLGSNNEHNQIYLNRNCIFEPSSNLYKSWIESTLKEIGIAFFWSKPAVISSHRVNFIGAIDPSNRTRNLALLNELLKKILAKWPEVEFMTSDQLGRIIENDG